MIITMSQRWSSLNLTIRSSDRVDRCVERFRILFREISESVANSREVSFAINPWIVKSHDSRHIAIQCHVKHGKIY